MGQFILGSFVAVIALGIVIPGLFLDLPDVWFAAVLLASVPLAITFPVSIAIAYGSTMDRRLGASAPDAFKPGEPLFSS